jgi:hypothetical protein
MNARSDANPPKVLPVLDRLTQEELVQLNHVDAQTTAFALT